MRTMGRPGELFRRRKIKNVVMMTLTGLCTVLAVSILFFILGYMTIQGVSVISWDFLVNLPKPVGEEGGGIANSIVGSLKIVGLASLIGIPAGVFAGVYLAEFGNNRLGFFIRYAADLLNGVPSIVMGIFAYTLIVLPMRQFSGFAGSVALAVIMIPLVLRNTEEFIRLVPLSIREAALALGVPQWKVILRVVLPTAMRGIITGAALAVARVMGETAPLLFTAFGNRFWDSGFLTPMAALPLTIFTYAISPYDDWHRQAWAAALLLLIVVLAANVLARMMMRRSYSGGG